MLKLTINVSAESDTVIGNIETAHEAARFLLGEHADLLLGAFWSDDFGIDEFGDRREQS